MYKDITVEKAVADDNGCFIDVRSPEEFSMATIPRAVNIPLFDNDERHLVGLLYHSEKSIDVKMESLRIIAPKLPGIVEKTLRYVRNPQYLLLARWIA